MQVRCGHRILMDIPCRAQSSVPGDLGVREQAYVIVREVGD